MQHKNKYLQKLFLDFVRISGINTQIKKNGNLFSGICIHIFYTYYTENQKHVLYYGKFRQT